MFLTLVALILAATIVVFFSDEFASLIKKIMSIPGMVLFLPLFLVSWACMEFRPWILFALHWMHHYINLGQLWLKELLPFSQGAIFVSRVIFLFTFTMLPVFILDWINKKRNHRPLDKAYLISSAIFIFSVMVMFVI